MLARHTVYVHVHCLIGLHSMPIAWLVYTPVIPNRLRGLLAHITYKGKTRNKNTVCICTILDLFFLYTCKLFVKGTTLSSVRLTYTLHYLALHPFGVQIGLRWFWSGRVLKWSGRVPNWSRKVTDWFSSVANYSSRVSNWSLAVPISYVPVGSPTGPVVSPNGLLSPQMDW